LRKRGGFHRRWIEAAEELLVAVVRELDVVVPVPMAVAAVGTRADSRSRAISSRGKAVDLMVTTRDLLGADFSKVVAALSAILTGAAASISSPTVRGPRIIGAVAISLTSVGIMFPAVVLVLIIEAEVFWLRGGRMVLIKLSSKRPLRRWSRRHPRRLVLFRNKGPVQYHLVRRLLMHRLLLLHRPAQLWLSLVRLQRQRRRLMLRGL
jgi:hypothetical protein